eukprot:SAG31_NODE_4694_length_3028_cov_10.929327_3_plen_76_part_00
MWLRKQVLTYIIDGFKNEPRPPVFFVNFNPITRQVSIFSPFRHLHKMPVGKNRGPPDTNARSSHPARAQIPDNNQ